MEDTDIELKPAISRQEECELYAYLRQNARDALHYELIAKKIHRAASGYASDEDMALVLKWQSYLNEEKQARLEREVLSRPVVKEPPFEAVRRGIVGNTNYQAFLDTLEQDQLDDIANKANNVEFFSFILKRSAEVEAARKGRANSDPGLFANYCREWADKNLSVRVKRLRGLL